MPVINMDTGLRICALSQRPFSIMLLVILTIGLNACATRSDSNGSIVGYPYSQTTTLKHRSIPYPESKKPVIAVKTISTAWDRIRYSENIYVDPRNPRIGDEINNYLQHPDYLETLSARASPFLFHILEELESAGLPLELALLPVIESAWLPTATSKHGAAGLWQFMPATARHLDTSMDAFYDGRRDLIESTSKAIHYLAYLADTFNNDWLLSLAAYNAGPGTVSRSLKKYQATQDGTIETPFWVLSLPKETDIYVPRFLAILHIIRNAESYHLSLFPIKNETVFEVVNIEKRLSLETIASTAGIEKTKLSDLNAGYYRGITQTGDSGRLLIPSAHKSQAIAAIRQLPETELPAVLLKHRIKRGETLSAISVRYNVSINDLKQLNQLRSHRIRAGKVLLVPSPVITGVSSKYVVKRGDTLWSIAKMYKMNLTTLARYNQIGQNTTLFPGMVLILKNL